MEQELQHRIYMSKKNSPYIEYTLREVKNMEENYFILLFGGDCFVEDGYYLFTKAEVEKLYKTTLKDLMGIIADGNEKDRNYALGLIAGLTIKPMRLH